MKNRIIFCCLFAAITLIAFTEKIRAQNSESLSLCTEKPLDGIYATKISERVPLAYPHLEERDVLWEKRIWREIDVKELRNHHFAAAKRYFIDILFEGLQNKKIRAFGNEEFSNEISYEDISKVLNTADTIEVEDPQTGIKSYVPVKNNFDPSNVTKYRIKEVVYFDSKLGRMNIRILGIAPIVNLNDNQGNPVATTALCWFYYNDLRPVLVREPMLGDNTDIRGLSWDDVFQARVFSSHIIKQSNVRDLRLQDVHSGMAIIQKGDDIRDEIRSIEADFFSEY
jgi:gliding motility associated protien GldN